MSTTGKAKTKATARSSKRAAAAAAYCASGPKAGIVVERDEAEETKKRAALIGDKFVELVEANVLHWDGNYTLDGPINWAIWARRYYESVEHREHREVIHVHPRFEILLAMCETFARRVMDDYIGNFELQLVLNSLIYRRLNPIAIEYWFIGDPCNPIWESPKQAEASSIPVDLDPKRSLHAALVEIRDNAKPYHADPVRWNKVMDEVIRRYDAIHSPVVDDILVYPGGSVIGVDSR